jgi:serine/threonine-protein kinase
MEDAVLVAGYRLDRYELLCPIASGGMATVWLARLRGKRGFEKLVAIKTIKTELIRDPRFQEMFLDEARIASRIEHPNVAQILDLGEQDDNLYIVMEWVDGESLAKLARLAAKRGTPLPLGLTLRIMSDACAGLHAAHELHDDDGHSLSVVHRDVSPHNILVTHRGHAKVIDFGVATARDRGASQTDSGIVKGKVRYMAPEQVNSEPVDHRADVWAAGMCLYELITGAPPFDELGDVDVVKRLMSSNPVPPLEKLDLPDDVRFVLTKALAPVPATRFESAAAMRRALESAMDSLDAPTSHEDVAAFLREHLGDVAKKRREIVSKAIDAAEARARSEPPPAEPKRLSADVPAVPLTRAKKREEHEEASAPRAVSSYGSKTTGGATLTEQLGPRPQSRTGLWFVAAVVALGAGGWFVFHTPSTPTPATPQTPSAPAATASATPPPSATTIELDPIPVTSLPVATSTSTSTAAATTSPRPNASTSTSTSATAEEPLRPVWPMKDWDGHAIPPTIIPSNPDSVATDSGAN